METVLGGDLNFWFTSLGSGYHNYVRLARALTSTTWASHELEHSSCDVEIKLVEYKYSQLRDT